MNAKILKTDASSRSPGKSLIITLTALGLLFHASPADAETIYADAFPGLAGNLLDGTAPGMRSGTFGGSAEATWSASANFKADGAAAAGGSFTSASLPFVPVAGSIYTVTADVNTTVGGNDWLGLGFGQNNTYGAFILLRQIRGEDRGEWWREYANAGGTPSISGSYTTPAGYVTLSVVLDTTEPQWSVQYFANGLPVTDRLTYVGTNPTGINSVGLSELFTASGTFANFSLTRTSVLEVAVQEVLGTNIQNRSGSISFGQLAAGTSSAPRTITIKNIGSTELTGLAVTTDGSGAAKFEINTDGMAATLAPGGSTTFTVTFTPETGAPSSAALRIASDNPSVSPFSLNMFGNATVWTGPGITFIKEDYSSTRDELTPNVWLARKETQGLFNAAKQAGYSGPGPAGTEWAYGTTANLDSLVFQSWYDWHEGYPPRTVGRNAVLHLIAEDIYIDITFLSWTSGGSGGGFSYVRSTPAPVVINSPPTANAGEDQSIRVGAKVNLDGSASFDDNTDFAALVYAWSFESQPEGSTAALDGADTDTPSFIADVAGSYVVQLVVTDELGAASLPGTVIISSENQAPTAVATVDFGLAIVGTKSHFDGTGSTDPEDELLTFAWSITTAPAGSTATLVGADTEKPSLTTDVEGTYALTLIVSDLIGPGTPATLQVVATTPANYAEIQIVYANDVVEGLKAGQVTTGGNQKALGNFLKNATKNIQKGNLARAIGDLNQAIERTDGFPRRGSLDGNGPGRDWITDPAEQAYVYVLLTAAAAALQP